ncbi:MAG: tetratricopeptide repeat protein [Nitrospirota bacterium]
MDIDNAIQAALQHYQSGNLPDAEIIFSKVLKEQPSNKEVSYFLGIVYAEMGKYDLAIPYLRESLAFSIDNAYACFMLGVIYQNKGLLNNAVQCFQTTLEIDPEFADAYEKLGECYQNNDIFEDAISYYKKALLLKPHCATLYDNIGVCLHKTGQLDEAMKYYQKALHLDPRLSHVYNNLGNVFDAQGFYEKAIDCYQQALQSNQNNAISYINLGLASQKRGKNSEALVFFHKAVELDKNNAEAHSNMSFSLMASGDLKRGWEEFQWHWKTREGINFQKSLQKPRWTGFDISGCTVLLHDGAEGSIGFGDTIQFIRYVSSMAEQCAKVIFECKKELIPLLRNVQGISKIMEFGEKACAFDVHCFILDLPFLFHCSLDNIPSKIPYIHVAPQLIKEWGEKIIYYQPSFKIGLVWGQGHVGEFGKCCSLVTYSPLGFSNHITFFSLQKGDSAKQAKTSPQGMNIIDLTDDIHDFADTAALIENLDLVISVDTSVAHLAGALGKPVWTLLPFASCWRWMLDREDSPWYPTMRLFRQPSPGDWESVIIKVRDELRKLLNV